MGVSEAVERTRGAGLLVGESASDAVDVCEAVGRMTGESESVGEAACITAGFAISTYAKGCARVGVMMLFKLSTGDEVAVHAPMPTATQIKAMTKTG